jgi:hypothetical protein
MPEENNTRRVPLSQAAKSRKTVLRRLIIKKRLKVIREVIVRLTVGTVGKHTPCRRSCGLSHPHLDTVNRADADAMTLGGSVDDEP